MTYTNPDVDTWQYKAEHEAATARQIADQRFNSDSSRAARAAVAQVHATLAVAAEIRAFSLRLEETMLDLHVTWTNRLDGRSE